MAIRPDAPPCDRAENVSHDERDNARSEETPGMMLPAIPGVSLSARQVKIGGDVSESPYRTAAMSYWQAGWRGILPLHAVDRFGNVVSTAPTKRLGIKGWTGHEGKTPSFADVHAWVEGPEGDANIALRFPHDVLGIDVDDYGTKPGARTLAEWEERHGELPPTWRSSARPWPSGIRLYRVPTGLRWPGQVGAGIEIIQFAHRYAVVWPSWNPEAEEQYRWYPDERMVYTVHADGSAARLPSPDELPELPPAWVEALTGGTLLEVEHKAHVTTVQVAEWIKRHSFDGTCRMMHNVVTQTEREFGSGSRHDTLNRGVLQAIRLASGGHRGLHGALIGVRDAFDRAADDSLRGAKRDDHARDAEWNRSVDGAVSLIIASTPANEPWPCFCDDDPGSLVPTPIAGPVAGPLLIDPATLASVVAEAAAVAAARIGSPPEDGAQPADGAIDTWAPLDLGPYLRGEVEQVTPGVGVIRTDGVRFLYPRREHACIGEAEAGKSWFALACVAAELRAGNAVVYVHFEEADPSDTLARLLLLGIAGSRILAGFRFVAPGARITERAVMCLTDIPPTLVVLDGQNEAMALHGFDIMAPEGVAAYRRALVHPFKQVGAAVLSLDHVVKDADRNGGGYALGSVHKINGIDGAVILLENREPFGKGRRGRSSLYVTKDRPGELRRQGKPTAIGRKFHIGEMVVDAETDDLGMNIWAPAEDEPDDGGMRPTADDLVVLAAVKRLIEDGKEPSGRMVRESLSMKKETVAGCLVRLVLMDMLTERDGAHRARIYALPESKHDGESAD